MWKAARTLAANVAIASALCEAFRLGDTRGLQSAFNAIAYRAEGAIAPDPLDMWRPGCQRPARRGE